MPAKMSRGGGPDERDGWDIPETMRPGFNTSVGMKRKSSEEQFFYQPALQWKGDESTHSDRNSFERPQRVQYVNYKSPSETYRDHGRHPGKRVVQYMPMPSTHGSVLPGSKRQMIRNMPMRKSLSSSSVDAISEVVEDQYIRQPKSRTSDANIRDHMRQDWLRSYEADMHQNFQKKRNSMLNSMVQSHEYMENSNQYLQVPSEFASSMHYELLPNQRADSIAQSSGGSSIHGPDARQQFGHGSGARVGVRPMSPTNFPSNPTPKSGNRERYLASQRNQKLGNCWMVEKNPRRALKSRGISVGGDLGHKLACTAETRQPGVSVAISAIADSLVTPMQKVYRDQEEMWSELLHTGVEAAKAIGVISPHFNLSASSWRVPTQGEFLPPQPWQQNNLDPDPPLQQFYHELAGAIGCLEEGDDEPPGKRLGVENTSIGGASPPTVASSDTDEDEKRACTTGRKRKNRRSSQQKEKDLEDQKKKLKIEHYHLKLTNGSLKMALQMRYGITFP